MMKKVKHRSNLYKRWMYRLKIRREARIAAYGESWVKFADTFTSVVVREKDACEETISVPQEKGK